MDLSVVRKGEHSAGRDRERYEAVMIADCLIIQTPQKNLRSAHINKAPVVFVGVSLDGFLTLAAGMYGFCAMVKRNKSWETNISLLFTLFYFPMIFLR